MRKGFCAVVWFVLAGLVLGVGCSKEAPMSSPEEVNLKKMTVLFGQFRGQNKGQPPQNAQQFKDFLKKLDKGTLDRQGIDANNLDQLLVSSRDGKPFVWRDRKHMGAGGAPGVGSSGMTVMIFEQEGKGGKRMVAYDVGKVEEVDEATFRQLVPEAK
jgi:hypothetical protein